MKFELVEFYPRTKFSKLPKKYIGTVHIYAIDCKLDIRGIAVSQNSGNSLFFQLPHFQAYDEQEKKVVRYPHIRWTDEETQKEMIDFLHKEVKPIIFKRVRTKKRN